MPRGRDPVTAARDAAIVAEFELEPAQNLTHLARRHATTYENCYRILTEAKVFDRSKRTYVERAPRQKFIDQRPVSPLHYHIGCTISRWRLHQPGRTEMPRAELAQLLGMSPFRLHKIEIGIASDLTLVELQRISECIKIPLPALLEQKPISFASPSTTGNSAGSGDRFASGLPMQKTA